jgi:hypothetical protein
MSTQTTEFRVDLIKPKFKNKVDKKKNFNNNAELSIQNSLDNTITTVVFIVSIGYATIRYNVFKGVLWTDWPLYVLNKAFAVSSLVLLVINVYRYRYIQNRSNAKIFKYAMFLGFLHILISFALLNPAYYDKFYLNGKLTFSAGISYLLGAIATALIFNKGFSKELNNNRETKIKVLSILAFIIGSHAALQAFKGWLPASAWPGYMPPLSMISFLIGLFALVLTFVLKRKKKLV